MRLYLTNTATASPFPTTSKTLSLTNNASEVQLGPGEFDSGIPGTTDAGQWNPSSPLADTTLAAELDNTGASLGTTRQGWLYDTDLTGRTLKAGTYSCQLRLRANQGTGTAGRIMARATIVSGNAGTWTTAANLLTTAITGEASHSTGQNGWRAQTDASRITVTSTAANFAGAIAVAGTSTEHTFTSGQRLLIELGFGDADNTTDRTWRLDYNTANTYIDVPDLFDRVAGTSAGVATTTATLTAQAVQITGSAAGAATTTAVIKGMAPVTASIAGTSTTSALLEGRILIAASEAGSSTADGTLTGKGALLTNTNASATVSGTLIADGILAGSLAASSSTAGMLGGWAYFTTTSTGTSTCVGTLTTVGGVGGTESIAGTAAGTSTATGNLAPRGFRKSYWVYLSTRTVRVN